MDLAGSTLAANPRGQSTPHWFWFAMGALWETLVCMGLTDSPGAFEQLIGALSFLICKNEGSTESGYQGEGHWVRRLGRQDPPSGPVLLRRWRECLHCAMSG